MAKTFLEENYANLPEDLQEIGGEIFIYREAPSDKDAAVQYVLEGNRHTVTSCGGDMDTPRCKYMFADVKPCAHCRSQQYPNSSKIFHAAEGD